MSLSPNLKSLDLISFCKNEASGPFYLYDLDGVADRFTKMRQILGSDFQVHYAVKANHHPQLLKRLHQLGSGFDVVSGGELQLIQDLGVSGSKVVFSGVGKTVKEIELALKADVKQINVESLPELNRIAKVAKKMGVQARVAFRVNPDVDADTHPYIRTGFRENKFGMDFDTAKTAFETAFQYSESLEVTGLSIHIGSQIRNVKAFTDAAMKVKDWVLALANRPQSLSLDLGGGLGLDYQNGDLEEDMRLFKEYVDTLKTFISGAGDLFTKPYLLEPGRFLVARFGWLLSEVQYVKRTPFKNFLVVDAGMHLLMRPALYQAHHRIECLDAAKNDLETREVFDVVGPICESADVVGHERLFPVNIEEGDWIVIYDAGAYGSVMANDYNLRGRAPEVAIAGGKIL